VGDDKINGRILDGDNHPNAARRVFPSEVTCEFGVLVPIRTVLPIHVLDDRRDGRFRRGKGPSNSINLRNGPDVRGASGNEDDHGIFGRGWRRFSGLLGKGSDDPADRQQQPTKRCKTELAQKNHAEIEISGRSVMVCKRGKAQRRVRPLCAKQKVKVRQRSRTLGVGNRMIVSARAQRRYWREPCLTAGFLRGKMRFVRTSRSANPRIKEFHAGGNQGRAPATIRKREVETLPRMAAG
jgi:hypothetical protein